MGVISNSQMGKEHQNAFVLFERMKGNTWFMTNVSLSMRAIEIDLRDCLDLTMRHVVTCIMLIENL